MIDSVNLYGVLLNQPASRHGFAQNFIGFVFYYASAKVVAGGIVFCLFVSMSVRL